MERVRLGGSSKPVESTRGAKPTEKGLALNQLHVKTTDSYTIKFFNSSSKIAKTTYWTMVFPKTKPSIMTN